jgi:hypothetical protein
VLLRADGAGCQVRVKGSVVRRRELAVQVIDQLFVCRMHVIHEGEVV